MKTLGPFRDSSLVLAMVAAIAVGAMMVWEVSSSFEFRRNPLLIALISAGLAAAIGSLLYDGADLE